MCAAQPGGGRIGKRNLQPASSAVMVNRDGVRENISKEDILVVSPYNMQVNLLRDLFRLEHELALLTNFRDNKHCRRHILRDLDSDDAPRGLDFLFSRNRLNVAISRAQCLAIIIATQGFLTHLVEPSSRSRCQCALLGKVLCGIAVEQMRLIEINVNSLFLRFEWEVIMGLTYKNLDEKTRRLMLLEIERTFSGNALCQRQPQSTWSARLPELIKAAARNGSDLTLAMAIHGWLNAYEKPRN